ncbi:TPA: conjugal transfer protein TraN [Pseudomonas putida]|nr:conjugal transfer protein TraN [Pseudomonas putida]
MSIQKTLMKLIPLVLVFFATISHAADCRKTGETCVEGAETRNIAGNLIYKACWRYRSTYQCVEPNSIDYCAAISKVAGCYQTSTSCISTAWNGTCLVEQRTYRCDNPATAKPSNTIQLDNTYTITRDELDTTQCDPLADNPLCYLASHTCVEGPETRVINGLPVYKACWKYDDDYSCINPNKENDCQQYEDKGCTKIDETCIESTDPIGCVMAQVTYSCITKKGETTTTEDCSTKVSCYQGVCWDTSYPSDTDFAKAVAAKEAAREAGVYGSDGELFGGEDESCRKGYGGIKNCCGKSGGAETNFSIMGQVATSVGGGLASYGSKYMYDFAYNNAEWVKQGASALGASAPSAPTLSFGVYGLSYAVGGAAAVPATGMLGGPVYALGNGFYFDPYSFAIAVAIQVVMELKSCEPEEQQLGMHRGANLCHFVGSYCSKKVFGACVETTEAYCCYNSILAKIINEQGKPQIGKGWGTPESPSCGGFTVEEFQQIDFSALDLSEFVDDIMNATVLPEVEDIQSDISQKASENTYN